MGDKIRDAQADPQIARIAKLRKKWHRTLGLGSWRVMDSFERGCIDGHSDALAIAVVDWEYNRATIVWDLTLVEKSDDEELEWAFIHEAMHIQLNEMRGCGEDNLQHEERVASSLATTIGWVYEAGIRAGRKEKRK